VFFDKEYFSKRCRTRKTSPEIRINPKPLKRTNPWFIVSTSQKNFYKGTINNITKKLAK
jgi:hypothetical protein